MFTGIVEAKKEIQNHIKTLRSLQLTIERPPEWKTVLGDSIALDGVCLTVDKVGTNNFTFTLTEETLKKTTFGVKIPKRVNLERPLTPRSLLGGHIVQGHIDTIGKITKIAGRADSKLYYFSFPTKFNRYVVEKGSVTVDGISLTVVRAVKNSLSVSLVPYTLKNTTLGDKKPGDVVNLEFDILAKYIERLIHAKS